MMVAKKELKMATKKSKKMRKFTIKWTKKLNRLKKVSLLFNQIY